MADLYALHWSAVTHANEYTVEVNPGGSGWATLGTTSGTQYTVVNTSTAYQSNIKYRVKAKDTTGVYGDSPYSEELSITYYSITNTLTNCTSDNIQQMVANGFTYNSIITVSDGYIIGSDNWNITIGETSDKTKGTLSSDGKTLNVAILSANGNIVITASAALEAPAAPTITLTGSTISWTAVTGATGYRIIATADVATQTDTTSTSFDLSTWSDLTAGTWTVQVLSTNGTVYSDSSNTVTYTVQKTTTTPTIAIDGNTLKITDVENAQRYKIYANGELKNNNTTQTSLQPPTTVNLNGNVLTWNNVANNSGYEILYRRTDGSGEIYQTDMVDTNVTQHTLTVTTAGTYSVTIVTIGTGSYTDSEESVAVTYTVQTQLAAPTIAMNADGKTLEITDVENATSYDVYVDGTLKTNVAKAPVSYAITFGTVTAEHTPKMNGSNYNIKFEDGSYLQLSGSSLVSVEYYDANGNKIGKTATNGDNMATMFGVGGVNSSTVEYYGTLTLYPTDTDFGYFTVGNSEHLSPTISSSNPHTTKTVSGELNIYGKYPD